MMVFQAKLALLLALLVTLVLAACNADDGTIPPCTPIDEQQRDPCDPQVGILPPGMGAAAGGIDYSDGPHTVEVLAFGASSPHRVAHIVVRATSIPDTARCVSDVRLVPPTFLPDDAYSALGPGLRTIDCYLDYRVNEYVVGDGPARLTVMRFSFSYGVLWFHEDPDGLEDLRQEIQTAMGGAPVNEEVLFLIPSISLVTEEWEADRAYNVQRNDDGSVVAVHPSRNVFRDHAPAEYEQHKAELEIPLATLKSRLTTAYDGMVSANGGRIGADADLPDLVTNASNLRDYFEDAGGYDNSVPLKAPPPCGLAAGQDKPLLMLDCVALLGAKDDLRGTGTLNWSVDEAIADWDGVTVAGTPQRVTQLELANKSLTGNIPAVLGDLAALETLRLSGNDLTGCIPPALRNVPDNDLDDLGLPPCP